MLNEAELLLQGEHKLGQYQVEIARPVGSNWVPTVPPLNALVTNYRLILQPQTRRRYIPASIPSSYITCITEVALGHRSGVKIALKTGHRLYLYVSWTQDTKLSDALNAMLTSPVGNQFHASLRPRDLQRLIRFISRL